MFFFHTLLFEYLLSRRFNGNTTVLVSPVTAPTVNFNYVANKSPLNSFPLNFYLNSSPRIHEALWSRNWFSVWLIVIHSLSKLSRDTLSTGLRARLRSETTRATAPTSPSSSGATVTGKPLPAPVHAVVSIYVHVLNVSYHLFLSEVTTQLTQ